MSLSRRIRTRTVPRAAMLLAILLTGGCGGSDGPTGTDVDQETYRSDLLRNLSPETSPEEMADLVGGNHAFAFDIYRAMKEGDENTLLSPFSMRIAFAMAYAGARGQTAEEISDVLHYRLGQDRLHDAFNALDLELDRRNDPGAGEDDAIEMHVANAFWGRIGYPFVEDYLDLLALSYGSGIEALDFVGNPEGCRLLINDWVARKTRDRILDLLPEDSIDSGVVAVITNALYFKAPWKKQFDEDLTVEGGFRHLDGTVEVVPMLRQIETFGYAEGDGYQALELNYRRDELSMVFLLPAEGRFEEFESSLTATRFAEIVETLETKEVAVAIPSFTYSSPSISMKRALKSLGMTVPFTGAADFSGMVENRDIYIDDAIHKTFIALDEKGTEAAAATAIIFRETGIIPLEGDNEFIADRPFLYFIRDRVTGTILFMGSLLDPSS